MARKSKWQNFAANFKAMNDTVTDFGKTVEVGRANKKDYFEEDGKTKLKGDALDTARNNALADIYTKYGDAEGGLALRKSGAELQGLNRTNRIGALTEDATVYAQGEGLIKSTDALINQRNAAANASNASGAVSKFELENLQSAKSASDAVTKIFTDLGSVELGDGQTETDWVVSQLTNNEAIPLPQRKQAIAAFRQFGAEAIGAESDALAISAKKAIQGGLPKFQKWYNNEVADGFQIEVGAPDDKGNVIAYAVTGVGEDATRTEIARGSGDSANDQVLNALYQRAIDPTNIIGAAVDNLALRKQEVDIGATESGIDLNDSRITEIAASIKKIDSSIEVDAAQIKSITADLGVKNARAAQIIAETAITNGIGREQIVAQIKNITSQIQERGIAGDLSKENITYLAAKTEAVKAEINRKDPDRAMSSRERQQFLDEQFTTILRSALAYDSDLSSESVQTMRRTFLDALSVQDGWSLTEVDEE